METRRLGTGGPELSVLGFGSWAVGGPYRFGWGPTDDDESIAAIHRALDQGVTWIDTAAIYGLGHSEEVVGRALSSYGGSDGVLVFTKCGGFYRPELGKVFYDLRPESIAAECAASLSRLGLETIDLYQIHWPDNSTGTEIEDSWAALLELVDEGKVVHPGVSNFDTALLERCEALGHVASLQPPLNLIKRGARRDVIPWAAEHGTGVIAYAPMASGLLTGKYDLAALDHLAPDDWRRNSAAFQEPEVNRSLDLVERLRPIASEIGVSLVHLAIAWVLAVPGVTGAIVGARAPAQVEGWIGANEITLDAGTLRALEAAIAASGAGQG